MFSEDLLFYAPAVVAVVAALAAAATGDRQRAGWALVLAGAALAMLSIAVDALLVALAQTMVLAVAISRLRLSPAVETTAWEATDVPSAGEDTWPSIVYVEAAASEVAAGEKAATLEVPVTDEASTGKDASRWGGALLVAAFLVLTVRAVLMARWPLLPSDVAAASASHSIPPVGLPHYFLAALVLFGIGMLAVVLRRNRAAAWIGIELMSGAAVLAIVAVSRFVGGATDAAMLATIVVAMSAITALFGARLDRDSVGFPAAERLSRGIAGALVGIDLALLMGAW